MRDLLLNEEPKVVENVIPNLVAFHSILLIRNILDTKDNEKKKELEKMEREGKKVTFSEVEEEKKATVEETIMNKRIQDKMSHSTTSAFNTDAQKEKEIQRVEIERYGRMWIWEGYFHQNKKEQWFAAADKFRHINPHVI